MLVLHTNSMSTLTLPKPLIFELFVCLEPWVLQGGGFCGSRTKPLNLDLSAYDGLQMRVKGDGQIFKFNIKTVSVAPVVLHDLQSFSPCDLTL